MQTADNLCPGILHAVPAKDGLLVRIRTPGGLIDGNQLKAIAHAAEAFGQPIVDITARANIQLRGIRQQDLASLVEALASVDLIPSVPHDRIRNIAASPLAGLDPEELLDARPLVRSLDHALINDPSLASLPPKFNFLIDGGGRRFDTDAADIALSAIDLSGSIRLHLTIGGVASGLAVAVEHAVECMVEAAHTCLALSAEHAIPCRAKKIASTDGALAQLIARLSPMLLPCPTPAHSPQISPAPIGIIPSTQRGQIHIIPSIPLGRMTSTQAQGVAEIALRYEADLRLAPWRGVVLASLPAQAIDTILAELQNLGLPSDASDGFAGIAACAGISGCASSLADVRHDAALLAQRLAGSKIYQGWTINLSGCDKRCAMRNGATVELVATPSGYNLKLDGAPLRPGCSSEAAIDLAVSSLSGEPRPESEL
ncbi:precorrin-3B synthase [Granulicella sp. L60]|uniref:precorrin-3B synthase n=1 Tax=Granulicella sp. L60 TaxID=1641866 RepID=UPI00131BF1D6|nr:precorrin-3B synthase [Granulicella sp. L60]